MATTLTIDQCNVTKNSITITYSGPVDSGTAMNANSYTVFDANSVDFAETPAETIQTVISNQPTGSSFKATSALSSDAKGVTFTFMPSSGKREFHPGDVVNVFIDGVLSQDKLVTLNGGLTSGQVPGQGPITRGTRDVEDAISYPILTEEVAYRPSPVGIQTTGAGGIAGPGASNLGQRALQAVTDVLGWKANPADPKGFLGALSQSFTLKDVEGHTEATWTPRTYAVQTDLGGGITGAQASLYSRAKDALDQSITLLNGLYPLDPEADPEYVKALREMARSQMTEIVKELGMVGLPSILRIDTYFEILLGQNPGVLSKTGTAVQFDPDLVAGTLGEIRKVYGIKFRANKFNNSVEDEQDITNFRVISDYMTSLMQSWIANREFFEIKPTIPAFFGTQLVLISRQFNVIAETVNEARFALDSVFIGPNERQTLLVEFHDQALPAMFLEDVLDEIDKFVGEEGPRLLRDGGKISVKNNILPVVQSLKHMIEEAHHPKNAGKLPDGFRTARVQHSLDDLRDQLRSLIELIDQVKQDVPEPEDTLAVTTLIATDTTDQSGNKDGGGILSIIGSGFDPNAEVDINSPVAIVATPSGTDIYTQFYSPERIDVVIDATSGGWSGLQSGSHTITVKNPDGETITVTLPNGLTAGPNGIALTTPFSGRVRKMGSIASQKRATPRRRTLQYSVFGKPVGAGAGAGPVPPAPGVAPSPPAAGPSALGPASTASVTGGPGSGPSRSVSGGPPTPPSASGPASGATAAGGPATAGSGVAPSASTATPAAPTPAQPTAGLASFGSSSGAPITGGTTPAVAVAPPAPAAPGTPSSAATTPVSGTPPASGSGTVLGASEATATPTAATSVTGLSSPTLVPSMTHVNELHQKIDRITDELKQEFAKGIQAVRDEFGKKNRK